MMTILLRIAAGALVLAAFAPASVAQTIADQAATLKGYLDWTGEPVADSDNITALAFDVDADCGITVAITILDGPNPILANAAGPAGDIDGNSVESSGSSSLPEIVFLILQDRPDWQITGSIPADFPYFDDIKSSVDSGDLGGSCDETGCQVTDEINEIEIPLLNESAIANEAEVISAFQTLIALCAAE